jgi:hypothetical protein
VWISEVRLVGDSDLVVVIALARGIAGEQLRREQRDALRRDVVEWTAGRL